MKRLSIGFSIVVFMILVSCKNNSQKSPNKSIEKETSQMMEEGKEIASSTFLELSSELQHAMKSGGMENALKYCNLNAIPLTDSLSTLHHADIKRTSLKYRNPNNKPTSAEEKILLQFEEDKKEHKSLLPRIEKAGASNVFYAPIIVQDMCLKCHGQKEDIDKYDTISSLYPGDLAHGYQQGDLRGMWSISFRKNH